MPKPVVIDFETEGIDARPHYPPKPVGVAIRGGRSGGSRYLAWGHPSGNNSTKEDARRELKTYWDENELVFHNGKFDLDVAETHLNLRVPAWQRIHDTKLLAFLADPHDPNLSLKPLAARHLKMPNDEQEALKSWITKNVPEARRKPTQWGRYICRAPGNIVAPYAKGDVVRTDGLYVNRFRYVSEHGMLLSYDRERKLLPILLRNEREGIRVDFSALLEDIARYEQVAAIVDRVIMKRLKCDINLDSTEQLADALDRSGKVIEWTYTEKGNRSTSWKNLKLKDLVVQHLLLYREKLGTCLGTFMRPWVETAIDTGGWIHTEWNQVKSSDDGGARTGRFSSSPNFQNIPKSFEDLDLRGLIGLDIPELRKLGLSFTERKLETTGKLIRYRIGLPDLPIIRRYILPDDNESMLIDRDYNQQELRILAHFEDGALLQAYLEDPEMDVHTWAKGKIKEVLGVDYPRKYVKITGFGLIYGMGIGKLARGTGTDTESAKALKEGYLDAIPGIKDLSRELKERARQGLPIHTWGGREYFCEPPRIIKGQIRNFEYKLLNTLIQGSAADCTKEAIINYDSIRKHGRFMLSVHDQNLVSTKTKARKQEMQLLKDAMDAVKFDLPMLSTGAYGANWANLKEDK